jgi:PAS domain S-box-containing protein
MEHQAGETKATSERAERLANLVTLSYEPMLAWSLDGPIEFWNAGAERLYGFTQNEAVGRTSHALLQTKFPIEFTELHSQLRNERYWSGELRHACKDGREVIVDSRMQLLGDDTVLEVNRDVTEIKALVRDLVAAGAKFEAVFNQSGIFAGIMDLQGYLREVNKLAVDWCGYTREQVLDRPFWDTPWWRGSEEMKARVRLATDQAASGLQPGNSTFPISPRDHLCATRHGASRPHPLFPPIAEDPFWHEAEGHPSPR